MRLVYVGGHGHMGKRGRAEATRLVQRLFSGLWWHGQVTVMSSAGEKWALF